MKVNRLTGTAWRNLHRHRLRSFLMMMGIAVGITALTVIVAAGEAAKGKVMARMRAFGSDAMMVTAGGGRRIGFDRGTPTLTEADVRAIRDEIPGVRNAAAAIIVGGQSVVREDQNMSSMVVGVAPEWEAAWSWHAASGDFISDDDVATMARVCLLGQTVTAELFGDEDPIGASLRINQVPFQVKGVLEVRGTSPMGSDMGNRVVVPISTAARRLFNSPYLSNARVQVNDPAQIQEVAEQIRELMRERHLITPPEPDDFRVRTPDAIAEQVGTMSGTMTTLLGIVAGVSLLIGGIVVMNIMLISVNERAREIGLRMAVGARRKDIRMQFLIESVMVTVLGGFTGLGLGLAGAEILTLVTGVPTIVSWKVFILGTGFSTLVGIFFGVHPARRAAAQNPVEALR